MSVSLREGFKAWRGVSALAFAGRWRLWDWLEASYVKLDDILAGAGLGASASAALIARNRPQHVAALAAQIAARRTTKMVYSMQSARAIAEDVRRIRSPVVLADQEDWSPELEAAVAQIGAAGVILRDGAERAFEVHPRFTRASGSFPISTEAMAFELLSSGTTGAPKRIPLTWKTVEISVADSKTSYVGTDQRTAPLLMLHPLGNIAGIGYLAPALVNGQRMVLLERFAVAAWAEAVRLYKPTRCALPPAGMRMVLEARVPREDLESLAVVAVGGAKLDADVHAQFEETYGIPVLTAYGATEFGGVISNWTLPLYQQYGKAKPGSVGRASANVSLRVVDPATSRPLPAGETGILEALVPRIGSAWMRTTDLASIDSDGFLYLRGRADSAINRGGFKIVPEQIAEILKSHPSVADAAVVGIPDERLGEVPVAAIEQRADASAVTPEEMAAFARERLLAYQVPVAFRVMGSLPRNASLKVSMPEVRVLFEGFEDKSLAGRV